MIKYVTIEGETFIIKHGGRTEAAYQMIIYWMQRKEFSLSHWDVPFILDQLGE